MANEHFWIASDDDFSTPLSQCIKSWFKEQNTCPTCRNYALLPDEYPFLGH